MNNSSYNIALYQLDNDVENVIQKAFEDHPDHITTTAISNKNDLQSNNFHMCVTSQADFSSNLPILPLPDQRIRIGYLMDQIEAILFTNQYDDISNNIYNLHWDQCSLTFEGHIIDLSEREKYIIAELIQAGEQGCSKDYLLQKIWGYRSDLDTHTLETHIYRLRQKIEISPDNPKRLITIEGGYCLKGT